DAEIGTARRDLDLAEFFQLFGHLGLFCRVGEIEQRRGVAAVGRRLAEIIKSRPDKLARGKRKFIEPFELNIGRPGPTRRVEIKRTYLEVSAGLKPVFDDGKEIFAARTDR